MAKARAVAVKVDDLQDVPRLPVPGQLARAVSEDLEEVQTPVSGLGDDPTNKSTLIGTKTKYVTLYQPMGDIRRRIFHTSNVNRVNVDNDYLTKVHREGPNRGYRVFYTEAELKGYFGNYTIYKPGMGQFECPVEVCPKVLDTMQKLRDHLYYYHRREYNAEFKDAIELALKRDARTKSKAWMDKMGYDKDEVDDNDLDKNPTN